MSEIDRFQIGSAPVSRRSVLRGAVGLGAAAALAACNSAAPNGTQVLATQAPSSAAPPSAPPSGSAVASPSAVATATPAPTPPPSPEAELFVYNWADYIGDHTVKDFSAKYGIKVTYDFFDTTDTMNAKIATGNSGYDITFPTSTYVEGLVARNLVQPLDLSQIPNAANLAPEWANPSYDPGNAHSMPYMWWTTGVAVNTGKVKQALTSWDALWDPQWKGRMAMLDDTREVFAVALIRLGFDINTIDDGQLDQALALLQQQKPLLRTYTTDDIGVLSTGDVWVMHAWGADVHQVLTDPKAPPLTYYLPTEGAVRGSDTMVLLAGAQHPVAAHLFINYMLDAQVSANNTNFMAYMGPNLAARKFIDPALLADPAVNPDVASATNLQEIRDLGADEDKYSSRWTRLRAGA